EAAAPPGPSVSWRRTRPGTPRRLACGTSLSSSWSVGCGPWTGWGGVLPSRRGRRVFRAPPERQGHGEQVPAGPCTPRDFFASSALDPPAPPEREAGQGEKEAECDP